VTATLKAYVVDTIKLHEIDDLVTGSGETEDHLTVTYRQTYSVTFVSKSECTPQAQLTGPERNEMAHLIRTARSRLRDTPNEERALRPRDVPVTLLNIALLNLSASDEILRTGAYNLFNDLGKFYDYDLFQGVRKVTGESGSPPYVISANG
jgi:neurofibromin 1